MQLKLENACFEFNCNPTYVFTKKSLFFTFCFKAKIADKIAKEFI